MSRTIDERVVSMQFDNAHFEKNVATSMSTLEKLKHSLKLDNASDGMSGLGSVTDTVKVKFSALQVMAVRALSNITDSAMRTGKRMISALTIDPIKTGFQEYETQINSVQTILANTESKGTTLQQVNAALDELNKYADKTIYNFTEMTKNIGTFTAAGIDLDTSVSAIQGIANLAAVSGSTSQQASTAMYQLSQALSSGTVKLMDWNSVVNAGMGGQVFQDALKQTARVHGVAIDEMIEKHGSFRETLSEGWITSEILTETLNQFTMAAEEGSAEWEAYKKSLMDTGYTEEQAESILKMANTATDAATKVKTFTQLWDTLKESAQSGWTESWEIMVGDFEEAKNFLTDISDRIGSMIGNSSDSRNAMLSEGLSSGWKQLLRAGIADEEGYKDTLKTVAKEHGTSIDDMIAAEKKLDDSLTDSEAFQKALKTGFKDGSISADMLTESVHKMADKMSKMSAEELKAAGYTQDHVMQIKELSAGLKDGSISMDDFVKKMTRSSGRENLIQALWNAFDGLMSVIKPVKEAFREIFPAMTGEQLYKITEQIRDFTAKLKLSDEQAAKVKSTFKGLFAVLDIVWTAFKTLVSGIFKIMGALGSLVGGILGITGSLGDFLTNIRDSVKETDIFGKVINGIVGFITNATDKIKDFGQSLKSSVDTSGFSGILGFFKGLWSFITKVVKAIIGTLGELGGALSEALGKGDIFEVINSGALTGMLLGVTKITSSLGKTFKNIGSFTENIIDILDSVRGCFEAYQQQLKAGALLKIAGAIAILTASLLVISSIDSDKLTSALVAIGTLFGLLIGMMSLMNEIETSGKNPLDKLVNSLSNTFRMASMISLAAAVLILAGAMKILAGIDWNGIAKGIVGIAAIVSVLVVAAKIMDSEHKKITKFAGQMLIMSAAIGIMSLAAKSFASMSWEGLAKACVGLTVAVGLLVAAAKIMDSEHKKITKFAGQMLIMSAAIGIMSLAAKSFASLSWEGLTKAGFGITGAVVLLVAAAKIMDSNHKSITKFAGQMLIMSAAIGILALVAKTFASMSWAGLAKGGAGVLGAVVLLVAAAKIMDSNHKSITKFAGQMLIMSVGITILASAMKKLGNMTWGGIAKSLITLAGAFVIIGVAGLLLKPLTGTILKLAVAFTLFGLGMAGIGAGITMIAIGIGMLATTISVGATAIVAALTVIVTGILNLVPTIVQIIGKTIVGIATVIGEQAPTLAESCLKLVSSVLKMLAEYAPEITNSLAELLIGVINSLATHMPALIEALLNLLASVFKGLGEALKNLDFGSLREGITAASGLGVLMLAMSTALKIASKIKIKDAVKGALALTTMVVPLAAFVAVLSLMDGVEVATKTVIALAALAGACSLMLVPLSLVGSIGLGAALKGVLALTAMAVPMLAFVGVLTLMNGVESATTNALALATLATACTLLLIPLTVIGAIATTGIGAVAIIAGVLALTAMAVPMLAFVGVLAIMSNINKAESNAKLLTKLMTVMGVLLVAVSSVGPRAAIGVAAMTALTVLIGAIGIMAVAVGALMDKFPSLEKFLNKGLPILEQLAGGIGIIIGKFVGGIGEALSDSLVKMGDNIAKFMEKIAKASESASTINGDAFDGVEKLMGVLLKIGGTSVGTGLMDRINQLFNFGDDSMDTFEKDAIAFFKAMKSIGEEANKVEINIESFDAVMSAAERLAGLQSSLERIGGVVSWFVGRDDLGTFGINAGFFIRSMRSAFESLNDASFNNEAIDQLITASIRLADMQSSLDRIGGVVSWFAGRNDLATFGSNIASFISSMKIAFAKLDGVRFNNEAMDQLITASVRLADIQSSLDRVGGVVSWFTGRDDLGTFGTNVASFISSMKIAFAQLDGVTLNEEAMVSLINATSKLADLQSKLEPMGGVVSWFSGRSDLGTFGDGIAQFAAAMKKLKEGMGENGIPETVITSITNSGNAIIALQKALPEEHWFDGKMNLSEFSDYITDFSDAMAAFSKKASEIDSSAVSNVISTAYRVKSLIDSLVGIDISGVKAFTGIGTGGFGADGPVYKIGQAMSAYSQEVAGIDIQAVSVSTSAARMLRTLIAGLVGLDTSGIENFKVDAIGTKMKTYANNVAGIDTTTVSASISAANRLRSFISSLIGLDSSGITKFKPDSIGSSIKSYALSVSGVNFSAVTKSVTAANQLKSFISSLAGINTSGVASFKKAVNDLSTVNIAGVVKAFSGASTKLASAGAKMIEGLARGMTSKKSSVERAATSIASSTVDKIESKISGFTKAGKSMATKLAEGIKNGKKGAESAGSALATAAKDAIRGKYDSFYNAGSYLVTGFKNGISENSYKGVAKAKAMAEAAVEAARKALKINSPSKVFKEIGSGIPEGFAMGIGMLGNSVDKSITDMTSAAINSTRSTMSTILDALNSDMDAQPSIRPVLDLSDVKTGVNAIGGLFAGTQSIGVQSNLSAINVAMNRKLQNSSTDDVVSAINKLNDGLDGYRGDTYNFEGITYSNGDEISEAVQTLVRAAKVGRRA